MKNKKIFKKSLKKPEKKMIKNPQNESLNNPSKHIPEDKSLYKPNKALKKNSRKSRKNYTKKNPSIFHFSLDSFFIYDPSDKDTYDKFKSNLNIIKPKEDDILALNKEIGDINKTLSNVKKDDYISLRPSLYKAISEFKSNKIELNDLEKFILEKIENIDDRAKLSCRKLALMYSEQTGKIIHKTHVNNIMRKKLGLHYIKTSIKTSKINTKENLLFSFCFVKILIRCIKLGYHILFQDESSIICKNNHYRCWRYPSEKIFSGSQSQKRKNLILLISNDTIIEYKFNDQTTNEKNFLEFMTNAVQKIKDIGYEKYVIIMDNLSVHKTTNLINFYKNNKVNVLFNSPYCSFFNTIELAFRSIKRKLNNRILSNIEDSVDEVEKMLKDENIKMTLLANYKETLNEYLQFYEINKFTSFKNIEI